MHCCNGCAVKIPVITEVVCLLWYIERRAERFRCVCVYMSVCVRERDREITLGLLLFRAKAEER